MKIINLKKPLDDAILQTQVLELVKCFYENGYMKGFHLFSEKLYVKYNSWPVCYARICLILKKAQETGYIYWYNGKYFLTERSISYLKN